jgi:protein-L-isoaspartate(D-aspartate) O-methyltransferase
MDDDRERLLALLRDDPRIPPEVSDAMARVPREMFVTPGDAAIAYHDLAIQIGPGATISAPSMVAEMLNALRLGPGLRVLEIGAGSGYAAACMAAMGAHPIGVELLPELAEQARQNLVRAGFGDSVEIRSGDGRDGLAEGAPYDRILASAAIEAVPPAWLEQLGANGILVYPEGGPGDDILVRLSREGPGWRREELSRCRFVRMQL